MQIMKVLFILMMILVIASSEFEQQTQLYCHKNIFNQLKEIEISIVAEGFPENINTNQIQQLGKFLICCHFSNRFTDNSQNFQGIISYLQLRNQFKFLIDLTNSFEQQNEEIIKFLNSEKIKYSIEFQFMNESGNQQDFSTDQIFQILQGINFQQGFDNKLNIKLEISTSLDQKALIYHSIFCAILVILQCLQIKVSYKFSKEFENFTLPIKKKVLILPFLLQIIVDATFIASLLSEMVVSDLTIYIIPYFLQLNLLNCNYLMLSLKFEEIKFIQKICSNRPLRFLAFMAQWGQEFFLFQPYNQFYRYFRLFMKKTSTINVLFLIFIFHKFQLNWKIILTNLSTKIFYSAFVRSNTFSARNIGFNLWVASLDCTALLIQLLIFYLQNRYGPKNLILKCKSWRKNEKKDVALQEYDEEVCSICQAEINDINSSQYASGIVVTGCKHKFHSSCLLHWFEVQQFCPLCRQGINASIFEQNIQLN